VSQFDIPSDRSQEADRADRSEDAPAVRDSSGGGTRGSSIVDQARGSDLIADVTLAQGVTYTPGDLRVLRTSYVFRVNQVVGGNSPGEYVTVNDTGGVYPDGSTVSTENSFRLRPGGRYMLFADRVGSDLWLRRVLQVHDDGTVVADDSGRVVVNIQEGVPITAPEPTYEALRYVRPVEARVEPMDGPPDVASVPLPDQPEAATLDTAGRTAITLDAVIDYLRGEGGQGRQADDARPTSGNPGTVVDEARPGREPPTNIEGRSQESGPGTAGEGAVRTVLSGNYVSGFQSHFHFMPDDSNWAWSSHCRGSWNTLVDNNLGLFAYKIRTSDNQPIRDRLPVANNNQNNVGVLSNAQMTAGGYDTWDVLGANGVCYTWTDGNRVRETDILMNPAIAGDEAQFRKSLTHEYGHALTLQHETARMALMYPGTFRQPPNYASWWYSRRDDHQGVRSMLTWVNANIGAGTWAVAQFTDMATWSQAHDNPGTTGNLVMTRVSPETVSRGGTATVQFVHLENRGTVPAQNVQLKFYLSTNDTISATDHEIASFTWSTFTSWWSGSLNVQIPASVPAGQYFFGWIVTTDTPERSSSNNQAILMRDRNAGFAKVRITVT
jgi:Matrixin